MKRPSIWHLMIAALISGTPLFQRIAKATSKSLNAKAINHQKMAAAEAKRQRKQAKRLGMGS
jgi:hypothetical protein